MADAFDELENSFGTAISAISPHSESPHDLEETVGSLDVNPEDLEKYVSENVREVRKTVDSVTLRHNTRRLSKEELHSGGTDKSQSTESQHTDKTDKRHCTDQQQNKLEEIQNRLAAAKIQKARRKQMEEKKKERRKKEDKAASKIQESFRKRWSAHAQPKLTVAPLTISILDQERLLELRHMIRKPRDGHDARPADETRRVLHFLMHLPPFESILSGLPPRARYDIAMRLEPRQLQPGELLMRTKEDFGDNDSMCSIDEDRTEDDVSCLILCGSAAIFLEGPSFSRQQQKLRVGSAFGRDAISENRINEPFRNQFELEAKPKNTIEVMRLTRKEVDRAAQAERLRETGRYLACNTLKSSSPWCRETDDLHVLRAHLTSHVACFECIDEEEVDKVCQQAEYTQVACWEYLSRAGEAADGLRILLSGSAIVSCPLPPALTDSQRQMLSDLDATLYEDDASGEWELCLDKDACNIADVVATSECEVLFIHRALYQRHLRPVRMLKVLQDAACSLLINAAQAMQWIEKPPVDLNASGSTDHSASPRPKSPDSLTSPPSQTALEGGVSQEEFFDASSDDMLEDSEPVSAPPTLWLTPGAVAVIDGMLNVRGEPCLPLLRFFPQSLRRKLCAHAKLWRACRGELIFAERDPGDSLIIVIRGEVGLFRQPYENDEEQHQWRWQRAELHDELTRQAQDAADVVFAKRKTCKEDFKVAKDKRHTRRRLTPRKEEDWFDAIAKSAGAEETDSDDDYSDDGFRVHRRSRTQQSDAGSVGPCLVHNLVIHNLAMSVLDVVGRRWQNLHTTRLAHLPVPGENRYFLRSSEAERFLTGQEIAPDQMEFSRGELYVWTEDIGICTNRISPGQALGMAAPGLPGGGPPRLHNAVALTSTTDLLVFDGEAVNAVLAEMNEGINGQLAAALLRTREGSQLTPQDLLILDGLIQKHQAFSNLECRSRAELCRRMRYARIPAGEVICHEGDQTTDFVQILRGFAGVYVRECGVPGAPIYDDTHDGSPVLCAGGGNTFGEQCLLGHEEAIPQTVRAVEDVDLFRISCEEYAQITQDWWGEQSMRRRSAEVLRTLKAEQAQTHDHSEPPGSNLDLEAVVHVLRGAGFLYDHEPEVCREVVRYASLLHIQKGEFLAGFGDSASDDDNAGGVHAGKAVGAKAVGAKSVSAKAAGAKGAGSSSKPKILHIVLSGCIGRYSSKQLTGSQEELSSQPGGAACMSDGTSGPASGDRAGDEGVSGVYLEVQQVRSTMLLLQDTIGKKPLQASMADRVRLTSLQKKLRDLEGSIREAEGPSLGLMEECTPISLSRSYTPTGGALTRTATQTTTGFGTTDVTTFAPDESARHEQLNFVSNTSGHSGSLAGASLLEDRISTELDVDQDWTTLMASVQELGVDILEVSGCDLELREGESFGGWSGSAGAAGATSLNLSGGDRFRAHADTDLLVLSQAHYEQALKTVSRRSTAARAAFLAKHFPSEASTDVIDRLLPLFHEETRSMGCVVVGEGTQSTTVWMIFSGQCQCWASPGSRALNEAAALGEETGDDTPATHKQACANVVQKADTCKGELPADDALASANNNGAAGQITRSCTGQITRSGTGTQSARNGTRERGAARSAREKPSSAPAETPASPSRLASAAGRGRKGKALGILKEGQFVGLFSALFHQPEPLTVVASSAQVELLAISKNELFSRLPNKVLEALKETMRAECDWYAHRSAHVATLPGQVLSRMEKLRSDLQQVHIPRMIDSPFLRRHGTPGLEMLDKVCDRYGALVHPESEWLFATRSPTFFHNIRLANVLRPASNQWQAVDKAAAISEDTQLRDVKSAQSQSANRRFHRFHHLSQKLQESAYDNEYIAPESSDKTRLLSPKSVSQLNITSTTTVCVHAAEEMGLTASQAQVDALHSASRVPTSSEDAVPLLMPSRVHRLTSYGELAQQKRTVQKTSQKLRLFASPGREKPAVEKVTFRSKAMRDKQAGLSVSSKVDISGSVESSRTEMSEHGDGEDVPKKLSRRHRSTEFLPDICTEDDEYQEMPPVLHTPKRRTCGSRTFKAHLDGGSLHRAPTAQEMRSKVFSPDKGIEIGMCKQSRRETQQPQPPDANPIMRRPVWRRSRFTVDLEPTQTIPIDRELAF